MSSRQRVLIPVVSMILTLLSALRADAFDFFLHGAGPYNKPAALLFSDEAAPTGKTARYKDSPNVKFSGGNPWKEIDTWKGTFDGVLTSSKELYAWIGLQNSDDIGTQFDLRAQSCSQILANCCLEKSAPISCRFLLLTYLSRSCISNRS
jgi:hypothetical protein